MNEGQNNQSISCKVKKCSKTATYQGFCTKHEFLTDGNKNSNYCSIHGVKLDDTFMGKQCFLCWRESKGET